MTGGDSAPECPTCGAPVVMTVIYGPGDAYARPCGHAVGPAFVERFSSGDGGD